VARQTAIESGLYDYRLHPPGGERRVHLRVHGDGTGLLLVDVSDAIHLNATATLLAKAALDGLPQDAAVSLLQRRFRDGKGEIISADADSIYAMISHLKTSKASCPTCGLNAVESAAPFSTPVAAPYKVDLALTYGCNNACRHCYNEVRTASRGVFPLGCNGEDIPSLHQFSRGDHPPGSLAEPVGSLTLSQWRCVLDKLTEIGVPHVIFTGGEPTLVPWLPEIIEETEKRGLIAGLNTNGRRLAEPPFVERLKQAGLDHVQITVESPQAEVHNAMTGADSFAETVLGIRNALSAGLHTITNTTLTRKNVDHALEIVDFLHNLGLKIFAMNGMIFSGGGRSNRDTLQTDELFPVLAAVRDRAAELEMRFLWYTPTKYCQLSPLELGLGMKRCNAGEYSMCLEPNGDVLPCQSYYVPAGNILRDPWPAIWESELFRGFRDRVKSPEASGLPQECQNCPDLPVCGGGCRLEREDLPVCGGGCRLDRE
jgi:radical SAM protein with 4Fe4S-binding SPASM domain